MDTGAVSNTPRAGAPIKTITAVEKRTEGGQEFGESNKQRLSLDGASHDPFGLNQVKLLVGDGLPFNLRALAVNDSGSIDACPLLGS